MSLGATLAVTEILPRAPSRIRAAAVGSSPLKTWKSAGASRSSRPPRAMSPVASLMPMMPGTCARSRTVSLDMSATVRPGTL
ncbi:hypothetical protein D9M71_778920 [compost metagenome]